MLEDKSHLSDGHIEIVRMLFIVKRVSLEKLCSIFWKLYRGLTKKNMGIFEQFLVTYHHVKVQNSSTKIEQNFTDWISVEAMKVLQQCGRKYGFDMGDLVEKMPGQQNSIFYCLKNFPSL